MVESNEIAAFQLDAKGAGSARGSDLGMGGQGVRTGENDRIRGRPGGGYGRGILCENLAGDRFEGHSPGAHAAGVEVVDGVGEIGIIASGTDDPVASQRHLVGGEIPDRAVQRIAVFVVGNDLPIIGGEVVQGYGGRIAEYVAEVGSVDDIGGRIVRSEPDLVTCGCAAGG